ncbi:MAG: hypothetical protein WCA59_03095 [Candidatus Binataceae bacterium]
MEHWLTDTMNQSNVACVENVKNTKRSLFQADLARQVALPEMRKDRKQAASRYARQDCCYCSAVNCLHEATRFELEHGRLWIAVRLCPFHFEELADLVKRQGKDWSETRGKYDWLQSRLWAASQGLKSGL